MIVRTNFVRWVVEIGGPRSLAEQLHCTESAVYRWLRAEREPHFHRVRQMVRLAQGRINVVDVHEHFERSEEQLTCQKMQKRGRIPSRYTFATTR